MDAAPQHRGGGRRGPHVGQGPAPRAPVPQEARPLSSGPAHGLGPERPALHAQETMPEAKAGWLVTRQGDTPIAGAPAVGSGAAVWLEEPPSRVLGASHPCSHVLIRRKLSQSPIISRSFG